MAKRKKPKSKLAKRKANVGSTYWRDRADALWSRVIHRLFKDRCAVCDEPGTDAHHLITRTLKATRHSVCNGILLCVSHHRMNPRMSAHLGPIAFAEWMRESCPLQYDWVQDHKNDLAQRVDYCKRCETLAALLEGGQCG